MGTIVLDAERYAELINELEELRIEKSIVGYGINCLIKEYNLDYFNILANIEDERSNNDGEFIVSKIKEMIKQITKQRNDKVEQSTKENNNDK